MTGVESTKMHWYARQVSNNPCLVILVVLVMTATCIIIALTTNDLPSFKDPLLGFEPRGTVLAQRLTAWRNLLDSTSWEGPLTFHPESISPSILNDTKWKQADTSDETDNSSSNSYDLVMPWLEMEDDEQDLIKEPKVADEDTGHMVYEITPGPLHRNNLILPGSNNFFCNNPGRDYVHIIFESTFGEDLFSLNGLRSICDMDELKLRNSSSFPDLCERTEQMSCCKSWTIPNYIAVLRNKSSCLEINETDIQIVRQLLISCSSFYHGMKLSHDCATEPGMCRDVPRECIDQNAVYNILHYLADADFIHSEPDGTMPKLTYTSVFLPTAQSFEALPYYKGIEQMTLFDGFTKAAGMQLGLKYKLFDDYLIHDTIYVGLAGGLIFILLWIYTSSFFVTFMTIMGVVFSLAIAYFMYTVIYQINFFPFMNLLTIVIIIGIGADDACIYCKIWMCAKAEKNNGTLVKLVRDTIHHACLSMFVTSITTAVAFFASAISKITAVRCFSIFAGTAVLANFIFTVSWLPASVVLAEKWCSTTCCFCVPPLGVYLPQFQHIWGCTSLFNFVWKLQCTFVDASRVFFEKILPCIIVKPRYFWILFFSFLAVGGTVAVFVYPKLRLPDSKEFQLFSSDHPFERYDFFLKKQFWFERAKEREDHHKLPIRVVWGVLPVDNGNYLDPYSRGSLVIDPEFDISSQESQRWLLNFCISLRNQSFYQLTHGPMLSNCFIETFKEWMERRCVDGISDTDRTPCCETSKFPFSKPVFDLCVREAITMLHNTPGFYLMPSIEGPRFSKSSGDIRVVVIEYDSIFTYSNSYTELHKFKSWVDDWVVKMMETAPKGMRNGWFISDLEFFDLQDSLSFGTLIAIGVAVSVAFIALMLTTLNLLISIYAIYTIACVIVVTVGSLVLLGWQLNVLESTTVSVAIGLAIDLTIHYGVAYRLSNQENRESSVVFTLTRVGSSVAMAAFTTFMAGALMFPSTVLAYLQICKFLIILMSVSWLYSTFLFLPLLSAIGPENSQLQLNYPTFRCCESVPPPVEKATYALSESTLSSSSASCPNYIQTSESHELEPLTNLKGNRIDVPKYGKKNHAHRAVRSRSGSLSAALTPSITSDPTFSCQSNRTRKISLPTVSVTFHGDPSPLCDANSSAILCNEEVVVLPEEVTQEIGQKIV